MATQTQTLRRPAIQPERVHDYLYDKIHTVSSERDHARATFKAHTGAERVTRVPVFNTMFSELRHHPRFNMKLDTTDPVPKFISRQWRGYADQSREALVRHAGVPSQSYPEAKVTGADRYKYFRRPIIPFLQQVPPDVLLASSRQDPLTNASGSDRLDERAITPPCRTTFTQTDYRDSEAQTDPYTPEYVVRPGSQPELLTLATLSYGHGLPAGLAEVEMIERARAKREWEATLPPLNDTSQLDKRRKMMDDMETKEWALREQEIEKLQEARLEVLQNLLKQREEHHQEMNTKRLDRLWAKKQEEKEHRVKKIRSEHIKAIRKLTRKRAAVEGKLERRDVVKSYSDYGSQTYAPLTRVGVFLDRGSEQYVVKSRYLNTYQGLLELENSLPDFVTAPRIKAPKVRSATKSGFVKRKYRQEKELSEIHEVIKDQRLKAPESPKPLRFLEKIEKPVPRPPTPSVEAPSEELEEKELAVIFLQQLIRGRAIQNMMFEGKEKRSDLIRELRSSHALQEAEQQMCRQEKQATLALQRQRRLHEHKEASVDEGLAAVEGASLGDTLDFLSKELVRLQEERRIHAFSMLAERERRLREAEESGRRQVEERRRREQDELFKQVMKVHQTSVDTYLENVIIASVDRTADTQARREIQETAKTINNIAYDMEERRTALQSEEIVAEMVHGFLLPEVQRKTLREKVQRQQRKYLVAAHHEIFNTGSTIIDSSPQVTKPQQASRTASPQQQQASSPQQREATPVSRKGTPTQREGTPTQREGTPTQREGTPVSRQVSRQGTPTQRAGTPTQRDSKPASQQVSRQGTPTQREGTPTQREGTPTQREGTPVSRQGTPTQREGTPTQREGTPTQREGTPVQREGTPTEREGTPTQREGTPTQREGTPVEREGTPTQTSS